jgi:hypothetical protein
MIRLALAIAFLVVIGFVVYPAVILLKDYFESKQQQLKTHTRSLKRKKYHGCDLLFRLKNIQLCVSCVVESGLELITPDLSNVATQGLE